EDELPLVLRAVERVGGAQLDDKDAQRVDADAGARALDPRTVAERRPRPGVGASPGNARVEEADHIHRHVAGVNPSLEHADKRRADLDVAHEQATPLEILELDALPRIAVVGTEAVEVVAADESGEAEEERREAPRFGVGPVAADVQRPDRNRER